MTQDTEGMVVFTLPDGTLVSNDPRFDLQKAIEASFASTPNTGDAGIPNDEQTAQTQSTHVASANSGQPGVGENPTPDDATLDLHGPLGSPAQQAQKEDLAVAKEAGASPSSTSVDDAAPVDSNAAVLEARKASAEKAAAALAAADEEEGDPDLPYSEWTGKQLKAEVTKRNAEEGRGEDDQIKPEGKTKADFAAALELDDANEE